MKRCQTSLSGFVFWSTVLDRAWSRPWLCYTAGQLLIYRLIYGFLLTAIYKDPINAVVLLISQSLKKTTLSLSNTHTSSVITPQIEYGRKKKEI